MKIENKKRASIIRLIYLGIPIFYTLLISVSYFFFKSFPNYPYLIVVAILFTLTIIALNYLKFYYNYFSTESGKLIIRYLTLGPFGGSRKSMEMPLKDFVNYQITYKFYNYKKELIVYRQTPKGIAKYPSISISSLSKSEINKVEKMLNVQIRINTQKV